MMQWALVGMRLVPVVLAAVQAVEHLGQATSGPAKQDAAVAFVRAILPTVEGMAGIDLDDESVAQVTRGIIDAVVAAQRRLDGRPPRTAGA